MSVGITSDVTIDGVDYDWAPDTTSLDIESSEIAVAAKSETFLYRDQVLAGLPDVEERFRAIPFSTSALENDTERRRLQLLRMQGGFHWLALWAPERAIYTATEGQTAFFLPRRRRDAGAVLGRSGSFPLTVTRNSVAQTYALVAGSSPATPSSGTCNVATDPVASGEYRDYTAFALSACTAGDVIELTYYPYLRVYVERPRVSYQSVTESHDFVFVER